MTTVDTGKEPDPTLMEMLKQHGFKIERALCDRIGALTNAFVSDSCTPEQLIETLDKYGYPKNLTTRYRDYQNSCNPKQNMNAHIFAWHGKTAVVFFHGG